MTFSDHPLPPPSFMPLPFAGSDLSGFWNQNAVDNDDLESSSHLDRIQPFKRPRNSVNSNPSNFLPVNPRTNALNPMTNRGTGHIFYKTRMCLKFLDGNCRNGEHCTFAHGPEDLRDPPPNWQEIVGRKEIGNSNDDQRTVHRLKICKKYANGEECPYGENCNFLHKRASSFDAEVEGPRESAAISIGTGGPMMGNGSGSDQIEVMNNNKHVSPSVDVFRPNVKPTYWKTKLCSKWEITGHCPFGERCHFAHGQADLQVPGGRVEAEAANVLPSSTPIQPKPVLISAADIKTVLISPPPKNNDEKKCFQKWKGPKKINGIYADWIDDMAPPLTYPKNAES